MNGSQPSSDFVPDDLEHVASRWVDRLAAGLDPAEQAEFEAWLARDPRHAAVLAEMEETERLLNGLRAAAPVVLSRPVAGPVRRPPVAVLAAAAAIMLAALGWWGWTVRSGPYAAAVVTEVGRFTELTLPDGSVVQVNSASSVTVRYDDRARVVRLERGEAFFTVRKDAARPFYVEAGTLAVRAVGTAFNVRHRAADIEVLVTEGRVRLERDWPEAGTRGAAGSPESVPPATADLVAGQKATVPAVAPATPAGGQTGLSPTAVEERGIRRTLAWRERRLIFDATPLAEVVEEFNRYNVHQLVIVDAALAGKKFGGAFGVHEQGTFVEALEQGFGVVAERRDNRTLLKVRR